MKRKSTLQVYIYALVDPRDGQIYYVGQTNQPRRRFWGHTSPSSLASDCAKNKWIKDLINVGMLPEMHILSSEIESSESDVFELLWMAFLRRTNSPLTNHRALEEKYIDRDANPRAHKVFTEDLFQFRSNFRFHQGY